MNPTAAVFRILDPIDANSAKAFFYRPRPSSDISNLSEIETIQSVVAQSGWLAWEDYLWLVVASDRGGFRGFSSLIVWLQQDPKRLDEEISMASYILSNDDIKPFVPVLRKVMDKWLVDADLRTKYPQAVGNRYKDFRLYGRSLNFGAKDLEEDIANGEVECTDQTATGLARI
jgi:hypothetical protein